MSRMRIVAGIGTPDDYLPFVEAGADEVFAGLVPGWFLNRYGREVPLNRREVLFSNVQLGTESELMILGDMVRSVGVPVSIVMNSLSYPDCAYEDILKIVETCRENGFADITVADPKLIGMLGSIKGITIQVSGELGELNHGVMEAVMRSAPNVKRFIAPRQTSIQEMAELTRWLRLHCEDVELEAFALNEKCHFTGAYCNSLHCDELCPLCREPYELEGASNGKNYAAEQMDKEADPMLLGASGCGICSLWRLAEAGVTHLKLVSRGNYSGSTIRDIRALRTALDILEEAESRERYVEEVRRELFPRGCSGNCYYLA